MNHNIPNDLVFDDESLDGILYGDECPKATPADIFEYWQDRDDLPTKCLDAVTAILAQDPEKGNSLESGRLTSIVEHMERSQATENGEANPRELLKIGRLCHAVGRLEQAEAAYRQSLDHRDGVDQLLGEDRWQAMNNLARILEQSDRAVEAKEAHMLCDGEKLLDDEKSGGLVTVRSLALDLFLVGSFKASERLYQGLLARRFEQPGTLVHLARVLLMQDRLPEAQEAITSAWKLMQKQNVRQETPSYVLSRIIFFRILYAILARDNCSCLVTRLKRDLRENFRREAWTIGPVIAHFKQYIRPCDVEFLEAIAGAINSQENMDRLNGFSVWASGEVAISDPPCAER